jgi:hypothetical protein
MTYYYYSYSFYSFFVFFLFFFLILIILFPNYTRKDIVPPLSDNNYPIDTDSSIGVYKLNDTEETTFKDIKIKDEDDSLQFGEATSDVSYVPYYIQTHKNLSGYFELNIGTSFKNYLAFRVLDRGIHSSGVDKLSDYNYGWSALSTERAERAPKPIYHVIVPFNIPAYEQYGHRLVVQIAGTSGSSYNTHPDLELSSCNLHYYSY